VALKHAYDIYYIFSEMITNDKLHVIDIVRFELLGEGIGDSDELK
jgi:hypothetical protein